MFATPRSTAWFICWLAALAALGWYTQRTLEIGTDLRLFLPAPQTAQQRLLLDEIGEGPASRFLVAAIAGDTPEALADASRALAAELSTRAEFRLITNGEMSLDSVPEDLLAYRYLLSDTLDEQRYDAPYLQRQLQARAQDLASPAGALLEPWLPADPTLELLKLLERWQPIEEPNRLYDVWFDRDGERALLLIETTAPAFDPDQQRAALTAIHEAFAVIAGDATWHLTVSGPGSFSVLMESRTRTEAQTLGTIASITMILLLCLAYRRFDSVILSVLPLASAAIAGLFAVSFLFGTVHGITLAFGFTLLGVAQDYPVHLLSHQRPERRADQVVKELWPTLATGIVSTCIAYLTLVFSGVVGLAQLACFTVAGLAVAGLTTCFLMPRLMRPAVRDFGASPGLERLWRRINSLPQPRWLLPTLVSAAVLIIIAAPTPWWENDLSKLTPVPPDLLQQDQEMRSHLGTADLRYLLVLEAPDEQHALQRLATLDTDLQQLVVASALDGYDHAARYLPPADIQLRRQQSLPDANELRSALQTALTDSPFRPTVFEPFIADVKTAKQLPPLTPAQLRTSPLGATFESLLTVRENGVAGLVTLSGVHDLSAIGALAERHELVLLDLKDASESLVADQRERLLHSLTVAAALLVGVIFVGLRNARRVLKVIAPMAVTTLLVVAILHGAGVSLNLFHLIALMLAAGLGLDYALFFEHAAADPSEQRRTLHAVLLCSASTLLVFALLATSSLPVLKAIGLTVSLGVILNFLLALVFTRERTHTTLDSAGA